MQTFDFWGNAFFLYSINNAVGLLKQATNAILKDCYLNLHTVLKYLKIHSAYLPID